MFTLMKSTQPSSAALAMAAASAIAALLTPSANALEVPVHADAHVMQNNATFNYGGGLNIGVQSNSGSVREAYLRFNPQPYLPQGVGSSDIAQVWLHLYVNTVSTPGTFKAYRVTSNWIEGRKAGATESGTITWNNRPLTSSTELFSVTLSSSNEQNYIAIDVTDLVKNWIDQPGQNYGVVFKHFGTVNVAMDSKEDTSTSHPPKLDIVLKHRRVHPLGDVTMGSFTNGPQP
jgi:hypothetical protein